MDTMEEVIRVDFEEQLERYKAALEVARTILVEEAGVLVSVGLVKRVRDCVQVIELELLEVQAVLDAMVS